MSISINKIVRILGCLVVFHISLLAGKELQRMKLERHGVPEYCPSHCDSDGDFRDHFTCVSPPFCCQNILNGTFIDLECCGDVNLSVSGTYSEAHNCPPKDKRWRLKNSRKRRETERSANEMCPSFCDNQGFWHEAVYCISSPYCCEISDGRDDDDSLHLRCCSNSSLSVKGKYRQGHNCHSNAVWENYWQSILVSGIVLGALTLALSLCIYMYQWCKDRSIKKERRRRRDAGQTSNSNAEPATEMGSLSGNVMESEGQGGPMGAPPAYLQGVSGPYSSEPVLPPPYSAEKPPPYAP